MDQLREVLRLKHYSIQTERSYSDWIRRYICFHGLKARKEVTLVSHRKYLIRLQLEWEHQGGLLCVSEPSGSV